MPSFKCYPITDPRAQWMYCPSYPAAITVAILFGTTTIVHIIQATLHKKPFATVVIMGAAWEFLGYVFRILSVQDQINEGFMTAQQLLILLAPLWINAFVYMLLGRMIHFFVDDDQIFRVRARKITLMFVLFDMVSFVVQAIGGVMTTPSASPSTQKTGLHVYMGGVGLQLFFVAIFMALAAGFQRKVIVQERDTTQKGAEIPKSDLKSPHNARRLLYLVYGVLLLIIVRNIYRLVEFSSGIISNITTHEWYTYVFDALPMFTALVVFNIFHPGRFLIGPRCDFSEENAAIKAARVERERAKKEAKTRAKQEQDDANASPSVVSEVLPHSGGK